MNWNGCYILWILITDNWYNRWATERSGACIIKCVLKLISNLARIIHRSLVKLKISRKINTSVLDAIPRAPQKLFPVRVAQWLGSRDY